MILIFRPENFAFPVTLDPMKRLKRKIILKNSYFLSFLKIIYSDDFKEQSSMDSDWSWAHWWTPFLLAWDMQSAKSSNKLCMIQIYFISGEFRQKGDFKSKRQICQPNNRLYKYMWCKKIHQRPCPFASSLPEYRNQHSSSRSRQILTGCLKIMTKN